MQDNSVKKAPEEDFATHQCGPLMRGKSKRLCRIYIGNDYLFGPGNASKTFFFVLADLKDQLSKEKKNELG